MILLVNEKLYDLPRVDVIEVIKQSLVWYGLLPNSPSPPCIIDTTVLCLILSTLPFTKLTSM